MPARHEESKGYIVEITSRKQFAELIEKGAIGVESIELGMFHVVLNFSFKDGDAEKFKKHGTNHYNKTHNLGSYRPKNEEPTPELFPGDGLTEGEGTQNKA